MSFTNCLYRFASTLALLAIAIAPASAEDWYVDNVNGSDSNEGTRVAHPFQTINKALRKAGEGDRIILADSGSPYRESISLSGSSKSGSELRPFYIIGNGAVLDGRTSVSEDQWEHYKGDIFRFAPKLKSYQVLYRDDRPVPKVEVKEQSSIETGLNAGSWTSYRGWIYFRVDPNTAPAKYDLSYCNAAAGITLYRVHHVVIQNLTVQGFQLDGINCHDLTKNVVVSGITSRGNGRSGIFVGGASRCKVENSLVGDNGKAQIYTEGFCKVEIAESQLLESEQYGKPLVVKGGKVTVDGKEFK